MLMIKEFKSFYKQPTGSNELSKCNYSIRLDTYRMWL